MTLPITDPETRRKLAQLAKDFRTLKARIAVWEAQRFDLVVNQGPLSTWGVGFDLARDVYGFADAARRNTDDLGTAINAACAKALGDELSLAIEVKRLDDPHGVAEAIEKADEAYPDELAANWAKNGPPRAMPGAAIKSFDSYMQALEWTIDNGGRVALNEDGSWCVEAPSPRASHATERQLAERETQAFVYEPDPTVDDFGKKIVTAFDGVFDNPDYQAMCDVLDIGEGGDDDILEAIDHMASRMTRTTTPDAVEVGA